MSDKSRGIYHKFNVQRVDGRDAPGEKHEDCFYFVLDVTHDPFALGALETYAQACEKEYPGLAYDLRFVVSKRRNIAGEVDGDDG